eukprot:1632673-Pyramimonas_sp.AAC.1
MTKATGTMSRHITTALVKAAKYILEEMFNRQGTCTGSSLPDSTSFPNFSKSPTSSQYYGAPDCEADSFRKFSGAAYLPSSTSSPSPSPSSSSPSPAHACPTEERVRQKARLQAMKERGETPNKRKFTIEKHYDDCGEDLRGLGTDYAALGADYFVELCDFGGSQGDLGIGSSYVTTVDRHHPGYKQNVTTVDRHHPGDKQCVTTADRCRHCRVDAGVSHP